MRELAAKLHLVDHMYVRDRPLLHTKLHTNRSACVLHTEPNTQSPGVDVLLPTPSVWALRGATLPREPVNVTIV